jgi:phosphoglycolate phosphatase
LRRRLTGRTDNPVIPNITRPKLCVLDLDGTLVDSLRDIAESLNACLELLGIPVRPVESYRHMVGEGFPKLCHRAAGDTHPHLVSRLIELGRARYRTQSLRHTLPFLGVREVLEVLRGAGIRLGVISNKPHDMTSRIVRKLWPDNTFHAVQGYVREDWRKPNPYHLIEMCRALGVAPADAWFIGDTAIDVITALRAQAISVGVSWGFRPRDELQEAGAHIIIDRPEELAQLALPAGPG